jgi:NAD(P)-dependent dehydrogenase (short-subunit alcohol dehydrogenase family)
MVVDYNDRRMDLKLDDRIVLVTGGSAGIGRASALAFAREGANVAVTYNTQPDAANEVLKAIESTGASGMTTHVDLADLDSIEAAIAAVLERWGRLDAVVANAVRWPNDAAKPLGESDTSAWQRALRANLEGTAHTVRASWAALSSSSQGRVVLVSTGVTRQGLPGASAYAAAKAGLEGLASALKWEGGESGILVNVVAPGFTVTERNLASFDESVREMVRERTPSRRLSVPDDIASAIVYLASGANTNITGAYLPVAGGTD